MPHRALSSAYGPFNRSLTRPLRRTSPAAVPGAGPRAPGAGARRAGGITALRHLPITASRTGDRKSIVGGGGRQAGPHAQGLPLRAGGLVHRYLTMIIAAPGLGAVLVSAPAAARAPGDLADLGGIWGTHKELPDNGVRNQGRHPDRLSVVRGWQAIAAKAGGPPTTPQPCDADHQRQEGLRYGPGATLQKGSRNA
jgi:hypothetical protein